MVLEDPSCTDAIINDWQTVLPATLKEWQIEQKDLQSFFEDFRNNLLQNHEVCHHAVTHARPGMCHVKIWHCLLSTAWHIYAG